MIKMNCFENSLPPLKEGLKVGLLGGTFNPPHEGHALVAHTALNFLRLDRVLWMITPGNPFKENQDLPPTCERLHQSVSNFFHPQFLFTDFENNIKSIKTYDSLNYLLNYYKNIKFVWLMGSDSLENFHKWYNFEKIIQMLPIAIINRPSALNADKDSFFSKKYKKFRIEESKADQLAFYKTPVWCYIHGVLCDQSSTNIRTLMKN